MRSLANSFAHTSIQLRKSERSCTTMKKIFAILAIVPLALASVRAATEQEIVDHSASIIGEFRALPEHQIPRSVLRHARGLAVMSVVKAGFIFSAKGGHGVVVARTGHGWSGPSFVGTGGAGWGLQIGAEMTDFVIVLNNWDAVRAFSRGGNVTIGADVSAAVGPAGRAAGRCRAIAFRALREITEGARGAPCSRQYLSHRQFPLQAHHRFGSLLA